MVPGNDWEWRRKMFQNAYFTFAHSPIRLRAYFLPAARVIFLLVKFFMRLIIFASPTIKIFYPPKSSSIVQKINLPLPIFYRNSLVPVDRKYIISLQLKKQETQSIKKD